MADVIKQSAIRFLVFAKAHNVHSGHVMHCLNDNYQK